MYDLEKLERKCKRYYLKKNLPYIIAVILTMGALGWGILFYGFTNDKQPAKTQKQVSATLKQQKANITKKTAYKKVKEENRSIAVTTDKLEKISKKIESKELQRQTKTKSSSIYIPKAANYSLQFASARLQNAKYLQYTAKRLKKLGFSCYYCYKKYAMLRCNKTTDKSNILKSIQKAKQHNLEYILIKNDACPNSPRVLSQPYKTRTSKETKTISKPKTITSPIDATSKTNNSISIQSSNMEKLKKLFQVRHSYSLAIEIAKEYFAKHDYAASLKWAKQANKLDKKKEEAWILYAKSLFNLNKKEEAKKTLRFYLKFKDSTRIKALLHQWESEQ